MCGGKIDMPTGFCKSCGLESIDYKDREFDKQIAITSRERGTEESKMRKHNKKRSYGSKRGFTCILCYELFKSDTRADADDDMLAVESAMCGFEQPGSDLCRFLTRKDFEAHIKMIHGGRENYWKQINDKKNMAHLRKLESLNSDTSVSSFRGIGEK
jgi:transcription elongation factor Elf1